MRSSTVSKRSVLAVIIAIVIVSIIDTTIVRIYAFTGGLRYTGLNVAIFATMVTIFGLSSWVILQYLKGKIRSTDLSGMKILYWVSVAVQLALTLVFISIIIQMILTSRYNKSLLELVVWVSCSTSAIMLGLLAQKFFAWYRSNRDLQVILYAIATTILALNALFAILNVTDKLSIQLEEIPPRSSAVSIVTDVDTMFNYLYVLTSTSSFILMWIASVVLLYDYSRSLGRTKYWALVIIPLVYFLSQFQELFLNIFDQFRYSDPILFGTISTVLFGAAKSVGGALFGFAFWSISKRVLADDVKSNMLISSLALILLFTSAQISSLILVSYPPYGLVTVSFVAISSYMIFLGIYSSAISVSMDSRLRQTIRNLAIRQSRLLDSIGSSEMEQRIMSEVMPLITRQKQNFHDPNIESSPSEEEVKQYMEEVLGELRGRKSHELK